MTLEIDDLTELIGTATGLPDFSWFNTPYCDKMYKKTTNM
jgi:hypothetical protein